MLTVLTQTSEVVNCMTAENTVSRSELAQAAGMFRACHSSSLGPQEARAGLHRMSAVASSTFLILLLTVLASATSAPNHPVTANPAQRTLIAMDYRAVPLFP